MNKTAEETTRLLGHYRGTLRHKTIAEWAKCLEVGIPAIHHHVNTGKPFSEFIARHHDEYHWAMWQEFCYA